MAFFITTWFRRARLRKYSSHLPTGFLPLHAIHTALVVLDGSDPDCKACRDRMEKFMQRNGIAMSSVFVDLRKPDKNSVVYAAGENLVLRKDIGCFGIPGKKSMPLFSVETDLLVNLLSGSGFTGDFISRTVRARFKIGTCDYAGNPFDLVVTGKSSSDTAAAGNMYRDNASADNGFRNNDGLPDERPAYAHDTSEKIDAICNFLKQIV